MNLTEKELKALEMRAHIFNTHFSNTQRCHIIQRLVFDRDDFPRPHIFNKTVERINEISVEDGYLIYIDRIESKDDPLYFILLPFEELPLHVGSTSRFRREYAQWRLQNGIVLDPNSPNYKPWHNGTFPEFPPANSH
jgi:hypothetical protein